MSKKNETPNDLVNEGLVFFVCKGNYHTLYRVKDYLVSENESGKYSCDCIGNYYYECKHIKAIKKIKNQKD